MSIVTSSSLPVFDRPECRAVWGARLGEFIRQTRKEAGLSLSEVAPLAALTEAEWIEIEEGRVPDTWEQVCLMATALGQDRSWLRSLVDLCTEAWEKR
jgi:transcriptional regulator with XRE-family HTH domain